MTAMIIMATIGTGLIAALVPHIPKSWIERHIAAELPSDDPNF